MIFNASVPRLISNVCKCVDVSAPLLGASLTLQMLPDRDKSFCDNYLPGPQEQQAAEVALCQAAIGRSPSDLLGRSSRHDDVGACGRRNSRGQCGQVI